jgi:hypothetical protein
MTDIFNVPTQPPEPSPAATAAYTGSEAALALAHILDDYLADLQAGRSPSHAAVVAAHPELAGELRQCLSGIDFVHRATQAGGSGAPAQLGDFRILHEIGRGGMGVVYEAEQLSLHRRVALKVLRFGGVVDEAAMRRFQREAETVARLHHTNIVPIFAVGSENSVHYYAMQLIAGQSLTSHLEERHGAPLPAEEIARLGLQAAEALAHAHQRGVIHRDVKPSNLLLDGEGNLWLTDFGLARRADETTMTLAGAIMGTPRYMSPEQAAAAQEPIDHRTDIYSLGATLYELATARPVFDADTPQGVITQILNAEPIAPRQLQNQLPRDLETIVLKCLAKEPARRYPSAADLADDLRAFRDGRPIQARRPSLLERSARWLRKHRNSAALVAASAAAAVLLLLAGLVGLQQYREWQIGRLFLSTTGPVLTGELLNDHGGRVLPRFTVPTEEALALPAGSYQLRLRGRGFLDETLQVRVERGKELALQVSLNDQRLWEPRAVDGSYECVRFGDRHDVLSLGPAGVSRLHGSTGAALWTAKLGPKDDPRLAGFRWDWSLHATPSGRNEKDRRPTLLQPALDLDGDGTPDLVWASRRQAAVLALSGKTGQVLWCFQGPLPKLKPDDRHLTGERASTGIVLGIATLPDLDGDGTPELAATCASLKQEDGTMPRWVEVLSGRTGKSLWRYDLEADWFRPPPGSAVPFASQWDSSLGIGSSSSGGIQFDINMIFEKDWVHLGSGLSVPYPAEAVSLEGRPALVLVAGTRLVGLDLRERRPLWPALDLGFWPLRAPQWADLDGDGRTDILLLGLGEDKTREEPAVQFIPDGGRREVEPPDPAKFLPPGLGDQVSAPERTDDRLKLVALSLATRRPLWEAPFRGYWGWNWFQQALTWPVIADLDGDGKPEVVLPAADFEDDTKWSGVQVREGSTGAVRWLRKLSRSSRFGKVHQVNRFLVGPPSADGSRTVFTAVLDGDQVPRDRVPLGFRMAGFDKDYMHPVLLLDALSGKDGHSLWWARQRLPSGSLTTSPKPSIGPLLWWHTGADGWPLLVAPYVPGESHSEAQRHPVYFVSAGSGQVAHVAPDYPEVRTLDLNGDGVLDLLAFRPKSGRAYDQGGTLETIRGHSPEAWRRLGGSWQLAGDLDGDGIPDLVTAESPRDDRERERPERERDDTKDPHQELKEQNQARREQRQSKAISGRDGRVLWQGEIQNRQRHMPWEETMYTRLQPAGVDLDGDGVPDLFVTGKSNCNFLRHGTFSPLLAVSGRTGKLLWEADLQVETWNGPQLLACRDLDGDGLPEVLFISAMDLGWERPRSTHSSDEGQYWLVVLSGRDGKVRWQQPLCDREANNRQQWASTPFAWALVDLDGDGVLDVVTEGGAPGQDGDVRAFSGKDGRPLWHWTPQARAIDHGAIRASRPTLVVGDLAGAGKPAVVVLQNVTEMVQKQVQNYAAVTALDGATGKPRWRWREPVDYDYNDPNNGAILSRAAPLLVNLDGGKGRAVCVWTFDYQPGAQIVLLDADGKERQRQRVKFRLNGQGWQRYRDDPQNTYAPYYGSLFRVWAVDLDGDGRDELVYFDTHKLRVLQGGLDRPLWEWPLPEEDCDLLEVSPATPSQPALLAVRAGGRVVFLGRSPDRPMWTCAGSGQPLSVAWEAQGPRVLYQLGNEVSVCRLAQASRAEGDFSLAPVPDTSGEDPRFVQPLPWQPLREGPSLLPSSPLGLAAGLLALAAAVLLIPGALLVGVVRRRAWLLGVLPLLWLGLVWAGAYLFSLARLEEETGVEIYSRGEVGFALHLGLRLLLLALAGLPLAAFVGAALVWLRRRQWVKLVLLVFVSLALAALAGWAWLAYYADPLGSEQRYSWRGWYALWPAGVYAAGLLLLAAFVLVRIVRLGRWGLRRLRHA